MNIAFIPARGGSKSIPFKNIKQFCGKPLIYWVANALQNSDKIDQVIVATDSKEIRGVVESFNFNKVSVYNRNKQNSSDTASTESVMLEYINYSKLSENDLFLLVQVTSPFTETKHFNQAIDKYLNSDSDSLLSCAIFKKFLWNVDGTPINYNYNSRPRRQDFKGLYVENGAFYINKVGNIKKNNNRLSGKVEIFEMPDYTSLEIDEIDDWILAEILMKKYILNQSVNNNIKLFLSDVDGTLTDAGMYYDQRGNELKKFNTHDGMGFALLKKNNIKTGIITSENTKIVKKRALKLNVDYLYQGLEFGNKLDIVNEICKKENISLNEVAYIGDDINCKMLLEHVGLPACPKNAVDEIKKIPKIINLKNSGGRGAVREFIDLIINNYV